MGLQNILYYLREPPGTKTRILSHTTSASLSATIPILLISRDHGTTGPRDHGPRNPRLGQKCLFLNIIEDPFRQAVQGISNSIGPRCLLSLCLHELCAWSSCISQKVRCHVVYHSVSGPGVYFLCVHAPIWLYLVPCNATPIYCFYLLPCFMMQYTLYSPLLSLCADMWYINQYRAEVSTFSVCTWAYLVIFESMRCYTIYCF